MKNNVIVIVLMTKQAVAGDREERRVSFMYFLLTKRFLYCQQNLWFGAHIDTGVFGLLNDSGCIFVEFVLHCWLRLFFEERKKDTKI